MANRGEFTLPHTIEAEYERGLNKVARDIAAYLKAANEQGLETWQMALIANRYNDLIEPWARALVQRIADKIRRKNRKLWMQHARRMGRIQRELIEGREVGDALRLWMDGQLALIKSIPVEAAQRVHKEAMGNLSSGHRGENIQQALQSQEGVSLSKARLIARTETGRAQTTLTMVQSVQIGSEGYIWRTAGDYDVRPSHRAMEGKFVRWDNPPTLDKLHGHAGCVPNCRCYAEPVLPEEIGLYRKENEAQKYRKQGL